MKNIFAITLFSLASLASYSQCVKGNCHRGHGTFFWENGGSYDGYWLKENLMGLEILIMKMVINIKVNLLLVKEMELENIPKT